MKLRALLLTLFAIGVLCGCKRPPSEPQERVANVSVATVKPTPMTDQLTIRATVEPWESVRLSAEVPGRLVFLAKDEGDPVRKGERLFGIDKATYQAALDQAQAKAGYEELNYSRSLKLYQDKAISKDQLDRAAADRKAALAAVENASAVLAQTDIFSPIDGFLDEKYAEAGEFVGAGSPLAELVDVSRVKAIVPVPEKDVVYVQPGKRMELIVDALGFVPREGTVIFVKQVADPKTLTFPVHVELDNSDGRIRPGMIARVRLVRQEFDGAVAAPIFAVIRRSDGYHVFVEKEGVAERRDVALGVFDGEKVQVTRGLDLGDRLIVQGQRDLVDGDRVRVVGDAGGGTAPAVVSEAIEKQPSAALEALGR